MKTQLLNALIVVLLILLPKLNFAQAPPLGSAANFVLFTTVGAVTNSGIPYLTNLTGNVGTNSAPTITGFGNVDGQMHYVSDPISLQCAVDVQLAYNFLLAAVPDSTIGIVIGNGDTLKAGTYAMPGAASLNLNLTLNGKGNSSSVFIFKTTLAFSTGANARVRLINGARACNVFWCIGGAVSMGAGTNMKGTIISGGAISLGIGDTLEGRALSVSGAILTSKVRGYTPIGCGSPVLDGPAAPPLASAAGYAVFSSIGSVTDDGTSHINGDVGTNSGSTTGYNPLFVTGMIHPGPDPSTAACAADLTIAYNYLNLLAYDINLLFPAQFGHNLVLTPHTYLLDAAALLTDTVYLNSLGNANAVFIIQVNGALSTTAHSNVVFMNGTQAKNVYWKVNGAVNVMDYSVFKGTIVATGAITLGSGASLEGRALTINGAITTTSITASIPATAFTEPSNQTACAGGSASFTVTIPATAPTYQWRMGTVNLTNEGNISGANTATLTINPVALSNAALNYNVVIAGSVVPSVNSINVALTVNPLPVPIITGLIAVCQGTTNVVYVTQPGMTGYIWAVSAGGTITAGGTSTSNTVTVTWTSTGAKTVTVNYANASGCSTIAPASYGVTVNASPVPTIGSTNNPCLGSTNNIYYTESGMTGYTWTVSSGGTIVSGQGTGTLNVTWTMLGTQTVGVNYLNATGCTATLPAVYTLFVNSPPNIAGAITGTASVCAGTNGVAYSTAPIVGVAAYSWTTPPGATIASGEGTNNITVNFGTSAVTGNINVAGTNQCGNGPYSTFAVTVNPLPAAAGAITGPVSVCAGTTGAAYSVAAITNATDYIWTVPAGAIITYGGTTRNIVISFGPTAGTGVITVKGTNTCGGGTVSSSFSVTINAIPAAPVVTATGNLLTSSATTGNQWYYNNNLIAGATDQTYRVTNNTGNYWCVVILSGCPSDISNIIWIEMVGSPELSAPSSFKIYPVPNNGLFTASIRYPVDNNFSIMVYDQLGGVVFELRDVKITGGKSDTQIDLRPATNGIYFVVFMNSQFKVVRKIFVKQ